MTRAELIDIIKRKKSLLCVGLDTEAHLVPEQFQREADPVHAFNRAIIDATHDLAVAYKLNLAFYEALGAEGWRSMERTVADIHAKGDCFIIADAKRGDIGNTARKYAEAFFDKLEVDAVTLSPYMGRDSIEPFLHRTGKWAIVLGITSNPGADDFQFSADAQGQRLFEQVIAKCAQWGTPEELMFVTGATRPDVLRRARELAPEHFLLVPGVGAQGGDLDAVLDAALTTDGGLLINSSRGVLYAGNGQEAIPMARRAAQQMQQSMERRMRERGLL